MLKCESDNYSPICVHFLQLPYYFTQSLWSIFYNFGFTRKSWVSILRCYQLRFVFSYDDHVAFFFSGIFLFVQHHLTFLKFETLRTNHLGHFLLNHLMLPKLNKAGGRVVVTASGGTMEKQGIQ